MKFHTHTLQSNDEFPYIITLIYDKWDDSELHTSILDWCYDTYGETGTNWMVQWKGLRFSTEDYAAWFMLKWCGNNP